MKTYLNLSIIIITLLIGQKTIAATSNFYIEIRKKGIEVGKYSVDRFKKTPLKNYSSNDIKISQIKELLKTENGNEKVLFYFHSMWGSVQPYHKNSLRQLDHSLNVDKVITIEWHADKLGYKGSWKKAIQQGTEISPLIEQLVSNKNNQYFILCHSMGHRIFEGVIKNFSNQTELISSVFLAAADLDIDVFENNLKSLPTLSHQIIVYTNEKDRLLKIAAKIHKKERLGLTISNYKNSFTAIPNIEIINVTNSNSRKRTSLSNHIYFKTDKAVLRDIALVIEGSPEKRKTYYKVRHGNYAELK